MGEKADLYASEALVLQLHEQNIDRFKEIRDDIHGLYDVTVSQKDCKVCQRRWMPKQQFAVLGGIMAGFGLTLGFVGDMMGIATRFATLIGVHIQTQ